MIQAALVSVSHVITKCEDSHRHQHPRLDLVHEHGSDHASRDVKQVDYDVPPERSRKGSGVANDSGGDSG